MQKKMQAAAVCESSSPGHVVIVRDKK